MDALATSTNVAEHQHRWRWILALGVVLVIMGVAGITVSSVMEFTSVLVFGPMLLASSVMQIFAGFLAETRKERLLHYAAAVPEGVLGFLLMANPLHRVIGLIGLAAIFLVISGLVRLARSMETKSRGRGWALMGGVVALLLGIGLATGGELIRPWFVGLCIAIDFLCHGASWSALALAERKPAPAPAA